MSDYGDLLDSALAAANNFVISLPSGASSTEAEVKQQDADVRVLAMRTLLAKRSQFGRAILAMAWEIYRDGVYEVYGETQESFIGWLIDEFSSETEETDSDDGPYLQQIGFVVMRILAPVYIREHDDNPFLDNDGQPITVDRLIQTKGILTKAVGASYAFDRLVDQPEAQVELLNAVATKSRDEIYETRNRLLGRETTKVVFHYSEVARGDGQVDLVFTVKPDEVGAILGLLGNSAQPAKMLS